MGKKIVLPFLFENINTYNIKYNMKIYSMMNLSDIVFVL